MKKRYITRKKPDGAKTINARAAAHKFLLEIANRKHMAIYEALEEIERHYAISFCPELLKIITRENL